MIDDLYPQALEAGVSVEEFWNLSYMEVMDCLDAYRRKRRDDFKQSIRMQYLLASLIPAYLLKEKNAPIPQPWDIYPDLFKAEKKAYEKAAAEEELEQFKARRRQYAAALNKQRRGL